MILQQFLFVKKVFLKEKEKVSAFPANSIPVIRKNECQKTFGEDPWSVCNTIHKLNITKTDIGYMCRSRKLSTPMKHNEK